MDERLLYKCSNSIIAHNVISVLEGNHIAFRQHDEADDPRTGAYGPTPGVAIYVFEKDYDRALALIEPVITIQKESIKPFCPKCGSEDVKHLERNRYTSSLLILCIFFFIAPLVYMYYAKGMENRIVLLDWLAIILFIASIVIPFVLNSAEYKCKKCGKKFNRK